MWGKIRFFLFFQTCLCFFSYQELLAQRVYAANSVLATGNWYKIAVTQEGIYKVDLAILNKLGINTSNITSSSIRLYGNGGGMLNENNGGVYVDDLAENAIEVQDGGDGVFNGSDYFLFYAPGPQRWLKDTVNHRFSHQKNLFTDTCYYFISIGGNGKRIVANSNNAPATKTVNSYDERFFYENDLINFLSSGKEWYGEEFSTVNGNSLNRTFTVDMTGLIQSMPVSLNTNLVCRSINTNSSFSVNVNGNQVQAVNIPSVTGSSLDIFANSSIQQGTFLSNQQTLSINIGFNPVAPGAQGWLNWFEVFSRKNLAMGNVNQLFFRDWASVGNGTIATFTINNTSSATEVWDVTAALSPQKMLVTFASSQTMFVNDASSLKEYVAFNNTGFLSPSPIGIIDNQNLHNSQVADYLIIVNPLFLNDAKRLALFHTQYYGYKVVVATTEQVFNEFAGGNPDPSALRDFVKMYYDKAGPDTTRRPKYLLLLGAASFDYKKRIANNTNLVPAYESTNSLDPLNSYTSDDFFALLDNNDDVNLTAPPGQLDIGVGRIPAITTSDSKTMVDKIIQYHSKSALGLWRNQTVFVADDKDNDLHVNDAESVSADAMLTNNLYNQDKIYLDAYPLVSSNGGGRYPDVNTAIVNQLYNGTLIFNYTGHGGYQRLADEAVYTQDELNKLNNPNKLPLFITATCDFAAYDDPAESSLGIATLNGGSSGAIALMTTTRLVFAYSNKVINDNYLKIALQPDASGKYLTLGDAVRRSKNYTYQTFNDVVNNRKFTLLGDPAMRLAFPQMRLQLNSINGQVPSGNDTLKALAKYTFGGKVTDISGNTVNSFNGTMDAIVFDKARQISTLGNDPASPVTTFSQQTDVLYKGKATVTNGSFNFTFIVPKDINYQVGKGRISLYADDSIAKDANGVNTSFLIGGSSNAIITDKTGPVIKPYLNDEQFVNGGLTNDNPLLLVELFDSSGINTVGTGIGHDIIAVLDGDEKNSVRLNDYYEAALNSYQSGQVRYQLSNLAEGPHILKIKAWDVFNNSGEAILDFTVAKARQLQISHVLNYPNPFTSKTTFWFEHNQPGQNLSVLINIFSVSGKLIRQIRKIVNTEGDRSNEIEWDGKDASNEKVGRGVYLYHIIVSSSAGRAEATQKLYLL